jgi:hypothetical protein
MGWTCESDEPWGDYDYVITSQDGTDEGILPM